MDYEKNNPVFSILEQLFGDVLAKEIAENLMLPAMFPPHMFPALFPPHKGFHRDTKAMDSTTPTDVIEYPDAYVFMVDMPGLKSGDIKVQVEEEKKDNILVISGERKRKEEKEVIPDVYVMKKFMRKEEKEEKVKYVKMERRVKFMRKFVLADNANTNSISAVSEDGVLTVTVKKLSFSPLPKMPKIIQVKKIAS